MVRQSDRFDLYRRTTERLKETNRLYPCYETQQELELRRKRQLARGAPPIYDRSALQLSETDRRQVEAQGRRPHWRFLLDSRKVGWTDLIRGLQEIDTATLSDPVLIREDGSYLYTLPSVADDIDLAVTHVIRGEDHVVNTAVQVQPVRGARGRATAICSSQPAGGGRRARVVEAARLVVDSGHARAGDRGDGGGKRRGADRHVGIGSLGGRL